MRNELIDMNINTLIGMIPSIINNNNLIIKNTFDFIYDSSLNYIKVPVNTTGRVSATTGKFINLETGPITFSGDSSVLNNFYNTSILFDHSRFFNKDINDQHPISAITGLADELNKIHESINKLNNSSPGDSTLGDSTYYIMPTLLNENSNSIDVDNLFINVYNNNIDKYNYPSSYYQSKPKYNSKKFKCKGDYNDILNNQKYDYIHISDKYVKVDNESRYALNADKVGTVVDIIFDVISNNDFIIKLSSNNNIYKNIIISKDNIDLTLLKLICIDINDYGSQWKILYYTGNIKIN